MNAQAALQQLDATAGIANVRCLHVNDSKGAAGSRLDRHEHIGKGTIGKAKGGGFPTFLNHPHLRGVPKIMETPKGENARGVAFDTPSTCGNCGRCSIDGPLNTWAQRIPLSRADIFTT